MPDGPTHIFVLAEDTAQQNLIRRYLERCKYPQRSPRYEPLPNGQGSGEQFVRERFAGVLDKVRSSLGKRVSAMAIVMIDADIQTVAERRQQLLSQAGHLNIPAEAVVLIPKRNVETWIGALTGNAVDEVTDYKVTYGDASLIRRAAATLFGWTRPNAPLPAGIPASLAASIPEWQKI